MKKYRFLLFLLAVFLLCASVTFASCTGNGDETTVGLDQPSLTDEPTEAPDVTDEPTAEVTTTPEVTTEEVTTETPEVTTDAPEETTAEPEVTTEPPHVHSFGAWNTVKITSCTEEGLVERICSCGVKETQPVAKIEHRAGEWIVDKEATAAEEGSKHQVCAVCGVTLKAETIPVTPHIPGEWVVTKEATCTEAGSKHRVCTKCGEVADTEVIPAKGHKEVIDPAKDATCTESGLTEGKHCSVCNTVITAQKAVAAKGHSEKVIPAKAATCTETGLTEGKVCSVCNTVTKAQETVPVKEHTAKAIPAKAATCTETGLTEGKVCSVCNKVLTAQDTVPAKGHSEETVPSCAPTCTASGLTEGKSCKVCGETIVVQQTVPATGHKGGEWIIDKEATLTSTGSKHQVCSVCGETVKTETIPVLQPVKADYTVTVLDGFGNPVSGIKVSFMSGNASVADAVTDNSGKASAKLNEGNYNIAVDAGDDYYAPSSVKLTVTAPNAEIILVGYAKNPELVYPDDKNGVYRVSVGSVRVPVAKDEIRYFFFAPAEGAKYKVYTDSDKVEVGYYGGSFYVTPNNTGKIDANGVMNLEVLHSQVGNTMVIGLKSTSAAVDECTLTIVRDSDIGITDAERPWEQYQLDHTPKKADKETSGSLHYVQITVMLPAGGAVSEIPVYYNAKDGYYHLNSEDGPVLYVRLNEKTIFQEALVTIANVTNIGRYFYDENGNFLKKESYNDAIIAYSAVADANGVVPLDEDLIYILKNMGESGWYDRTSPNCIFTDDGVIVMPFNGWLFACCYFS